MLSKPFHHTKVSSIPAWLQRRLAASASGDSTIRNDVRKSGRLDDQGKGCGCHETCWNVTRGNRTFSTSTIDPVHLRFLKVGRTQPVVDIESIHPQK